MELLRGVCSAGVTIMLNRLNNFSLPAIVLTAVLAACTPQQMLLNAMIPDGTASMLFSHLQDVEDSNRQRIVELEQRGDWAGLVEFADANIAKDPFSANWRMIGGYAQSQLRNYPQATDYFGEMVRLAPDEAAGYHFLAEAQRADGQPLRALTTLERALLVVRQSALTHHLLGEVNSDLGRYRRAAGAYRRAVDIDPLLDKAWFGLGRASLRLRRAGDVQEALHALEEMPSPRAAELLTLINNSK